MKLLLITGAGASRDLSNDEATPLPLMGDWSDRLRDRIGPAVSEMTGLSSAQDGVQFEERLGALLRWELTLPTMTEFAEMARENPTNDGAWPQRLRTALENAARNMDMFTTALHESLFAEFGPDRLDEDSCASAYGWLLQRLANESKELELVIATTNYDRSIELAFPAIEGTGPLRTGFGDSTGLIRTPALDADGLGEFGPRPSLIYLHGAVGWYRKTVDGPITASAADAGYNDTLGTPAVLYPDPKKNIEESYTQDLWSEFKAALSASSHVLVIGHSLNDPYLSEALLQVSQQTKIAYVLRTTPGEPMDADRAQDIREALGRAEVLPGQFGPEPYLNGKTLTRWATNRPIPAELKLS